MDVLGVQSLLQNKRVKKELQEALEKLRLLESGSLKTQLQVLSL